MRTNVKLVYGAGGIGTTTKSFTYQWDTPEKVSQYLGVLKDLGFQELDSAASYPPTNPWNTETLLGQAGALEKGFQVDTKILGMTDDERPLSRKNIEKSLVTSLELLGVEKVALLYAHAPDKNTPLEETAAAFHEQHIAGRFEHLGLCNYSAHDLKEYISICEKNGFIQPAVIQDEYNALNRRVESEIIPLCRQHGMVFYGFSPLAGGFLTGKVTFSKILDDPQYQPLPERTRWGGESGWQVYNDIFDHDHIHAAIRKLRLVCDEHGFSLAEASLRWLMYHSALRPADGIILGATKEHQIRGNVTAIGNGELPSTLLAALEQMHKEAQMKSKMFG